MTDKISLGPSATVDVTAQKSNHPQRRFPESATRHVARLCTVAGRLGGLLGGLIGGGSLAVVFSRSGGPVVPLCAGKAAERLGLCRAAATPKPGTTLTSVPHATWAKAARDVSGAFAAWSHRFETTPGPLAATAAELSRTAQLRSPRQHGKPVALPSIAGTAMLFMAASSKNKSAAQTALMVQLINTAFAVYEMHQQSGRTREAQRIRAVVEQQLAPFTATMPKPVLVGAEQQAATGAAAPARAVDIARRGVAPTRPGSAVPQTPTPAKPAKNFQPSRRDAGAGQDR